MGVDQKDVDAAKDILVPGEVAQMTAKQRRIGPGGSVANPTSIIATNKRIIIINRASLGIRKDYEAIPYRQISSVRLERGLLASSVFIRVQGYDTDKGLLKGGKEEGEIDGLSGSDAKDLADFISKQIVDVGSGGGPEPGAADSGDAGYRYCEHCGTKNRADAKFCSNCGKML